MLTFGVQIGQSLVVAKRLPFIKEKEPVVDDIHLSDFESRREYQKEYMRQYRKARR